MRFLAEIEVEGRRAVSWRRKGGGGRTGRSIWGCGEGNGHNGGLLGPS